MGFETIQLEQRDGIAQLTINRPKALNALNGQVLEELESALTQLDAPGAAARALIVTGAGEKAFVAGADLAAMVKMAPAEARAFGALGHKVMAHLEGLSIPTIAAVNGFALGGGLELALACDFIYASDKAVLGLPEVGLGIIPGFGGTQRLPRVVGRARAKHLIFTGERLDAQKAKEIGLVLEVVPGDKLIETVQAVAAKIAKNGPLAVAQAKRVVELGEDVELARANALERQAFEHLFGTADQREGMGAFLEKRAPTFQGK
jgi:enoyl-CoA hydratase